MINTLAILTGNTLAIVLVVILMLNLPYGFVRDSIQRKIFAWFSIPIISGAVFGMGSAIFDGQPGMLARAMVMICGSVGIIMPIVMSFSFWLYVETTVKLEISAIKKRIIIGSIPILIVFLLVIINLWIPVVFFVSPENIYERGQLGLIAYVASPLYLIVSLFRIAYIKSKKSGFLFVSILGVLIPILVVSAIQVEFYGVIQAWIGFSIAMVSLYIGMQKDLLYTDSMTRVFNRVYLEYFMSEMESKDTPLGGIMIDIDHFKSINDTLGHHIGDEVIRKAANILKESADNNANVIRVGGDEFLVVAYTDNEKVIEDLKDKIAENAKKESNTKDIPVDIEFSMGSSLYNPNTTTIIEWMNIMDQKMYAKKAERRMASGVDRRRR